MRAPVLALLLVACGAQAEPGMASRATDVLAQPQSDAAKLATLTENETVDIRKRQGAWSEVKTTGNTIGWVRMLHLKAPGSGSTAASPGANPANALASLLGSGRSSGNATATTGVRGLDKEDLEKAQPDYNEFAKMQKLAVPASAGTAFARRSKLEPAQVAYLPAVSSEAATGGASPAGNDGNSGGMPGAGGV